MLAVDQPAPARAHLGTGPPDQLSGNVHVPVAAAIDRELKSVVKSKIDSILLVTALICVAVDETIRQGCGESSG